MARAVLAAAQSLTAAFILVAVSLAGSASVATGQAAQCSPRVLAGAPASRQKEVQELRQRAEAGPFYKELVRRLGKPHACKIRLDDESITLSYAFRGNAHLEARTNPSIEFSEQRAQVRGIDGNEALRLLQEAEKDSFGQDGCGIDWNHPPEKLAGARAGAREVVYRGDTCNCQARIVYEGDSVVALVLSSAC